MTSLGSTIRNARDRRQIPVFPAGDIGALAKALSLPSPVSMAKNLIPALSKLPFATITRDSAALTAGFVHASAQLGLQSDGKASLRGHLKENGVTGDNFLLAASLTNVKDSNGATLLFAQTGNLAGSLTIGKDHAEFQIDTSSQVIAEKWEDVKNSPVQFHLHVSTDPFQLVEGVLGSFLVLGLVKLLEEAANHSVSCKWSDDGDAQDGDMEQCSGTDIEIDGGDEGEE